MNLSIGFLRTILTIRIVFCRIIVTARFRNAEATASSNIMKANFSFSVLAASEPARQGFKENHKKMVIYTINKWDLMGVIADL